METPLTNTKSVVSVVRPAFIEGKTIGKVIRYLKSFLDYIHIEMMIVGPN